MMDVPQENLAELPNLRRRIVRLPEILINQIAAGEVVERPASAIKELAENSLDALSERIDIRIEDGGLSSITVVDDGIGISAEDLALSVERHTTSKLRCEADLDAIETFGFRGEALSSLCSVAEVSIKSRTAEMAFASIVDIHYGRVLDFPRPTGASPGTTISVRKLFSQTPGRFKYLRSAGTEFSHCSRVVKELALGQSQATFSLYHQGNLIHQYSSRGRRQRFHECFKVDWDPLHFTADELDGRLEIFLSPPNVTQSRGEIYLYINGRIVKNRSLIAAARNAYQLGAAARPDPSGVIYLDIRKDWVDVNVHPQKLEVRCLRPELLYGWITSAIKKMLSGFSGTPKALSAEKLIALEIREQNAIPTPAPIRDNERIRFFGQIKNAYLLCEDEGGIFLWDQHALDETLKLAEWKSRAQAREGNFPDPIRLTIPRILRLTIPLSTLIERAPAILEKLGFSIESYGDRDFAISAIPELIDESQSESLLQVLLENIASGISDHPSLLRIIACHCAISPSQTLSTPEATSLLNRYSRHTHAHEISCRRRDTAVYRILHRTIEKHFQKELGQ